MTRTTRTRKKDLSLWLFTIQPGDPSESSRSPNHSDLRQSTPSNRHTIQTQPVHTAPNQPTCIPNNNPQRAANMSFIGERSNDDSSRGSNIILLIETTPGNRTFADYKQLYDCQNNIILMFEEDLTVDPAQRDFEGFMKWIDDLHKIQLFEFQPSIGRYKQRTTAELKALFESSPDNGPPQRRAVLQDLNGNSIVNGIDTNSSMRSCSLGDVAEAEDSSDSDIGDVVDWDE